MNEFTQMNVLINVQSVIQTSKDPIIYANIGQTNIHQHSGIISFHSVKRTIDPSVTSALFAQKNTNNKNHSLNT